MGEQAKVLIKNTIVKREINPRFELDSDYIEELAKNLNTTLITRVIKLDYVSAREKG